MHMQAREFVQRWARPDDVVVIEIGSRNVNGRVSDLFPGATGYIGIDIMDGPGVDVVCDAVHYTPPQPADCVVCCEVLEHAENWQGVILQACSWLRPGGRLIVTCAGAGRAPHSAVDGCQLRSDEHYGNLVMWELGPCIERAGVRVIVATYDPEHCDCRVVAERVA